jgi:signal transduction histidine kinase
LDKSLSHDQQQHFLQHAYNQALSLSEMIQDMSLLTRIEDAPHSFKPEAIPLAELLDEIQHDFQAQLNEKQIHFTHCIDHHVVVKGNRTLLYAIFRNLTDNVVRYAGNDIEITVHKYNEDKNFYYFAYADNGTGIPEEHLSRIFERFYRVDKGRSRDMGGSGLGLSIVKNSILFHKGTIIAKNKKNGGLEFLFKLPK